MLQMTEYTQEEITEDFTKWKVCKMLHFEIAPDVISKEVWNTIGQDNNCRQADSTRFQGVETESDWFHDFQ